MSYLVVGLFIVVFLAGFVTMQMNRPDQPGLFSGAMAKLGFNHKEWANKTKSQELLESIKDQRFAMMDNIQNQKAFLQQAQEQRQSMSEMVRDMSDKSGADWLRIKQLADGLNEKNRLFIEAGNQLIKFNEEQSKIRHKTDDDLSLVAIENGLNKGRFEQYAVQAVAEREDFINKNLLNAQDTRNRIEEIDEQIKSLKNDLAAKQNAQMLSRLEDVANRNQTMLNMAKTNEQRLKDVKQQNDVYIQATKERIRDLVERNKQQAQDARDSIQDQKRLSDQRIQDQMSRLKDQRGL